MKNYLTLFAFALLFYGFRDPGKKTSPRKPEEIKSMLVFPGFSEIYSVKNWNTLAVDSSLSRQASADLTILSQIVLPAEISSSAFQTSPVTQSLIEKDIQILDSTFSYSEHKKTFIVPENFIHILDSLHQDFGMVVTQFGFVRTEHNMGEQEYRSLLLEIGTLGVVAIRPMQFSSWFHIYIIDREKKNLCFHVTKLFKNVDPTDKHNIKSQLRNLLDNYFYGKP